MKNFFKFRNWNDFAKIQDGKELSKAIAKEFLKAFVFGIVILAVVSGYVAFDSMVLGEKHGLVHDDCASCVHEDYTEAKEYFSDKELVEEIKWQENPKSIIINLSNTDKTDSLIQEFQGCEVLYEE